MKKTGLRGVSSGLLLICLMFALVPAPSPEVVSAGGGAKVEVEVDQDKIPVVAITFDDGPRNLTTGPLLDGLALREVPATFFLVGERIPGSEDLIRRMAADGHQIGIHTYEHVALTELKKSEFDFEINQTRKLLVDILGEGDYWLRPPYGFVNESVQKWADGPIILWSVDPEDWKDDNVNRIVSEVLAEVRDGDIILLHDIYESSVEAALKIIDGLTERGYAFATVEQLFALRGITPERGGLYQALYP